MNNNENKTSKNKKIKGFKQCIGCINNEKGFCREYEEWCYMVNKEVCEKRKYNLS